MLCKALSSCAWGCVYRHSLLRTAGLVLKAASEDCMHSIWVPKDAYRRSVQNFKPKINSKVIVKSTVRLRLPNKKFTDNCKNCSVCPLNPIFSSFTTLLLILRVLKMWECKYLYNLVYIVIRFGFECLKVIGIYLHFFDRKKVELRIGSYQITYVVVLENAILCLQTSVI